MVIHPSSPAAAPRGRRSTSPQPPPPPPVPKLDRAAVARAEATVDEASRDRARAEARAADAAARLEAAANQAALDAAMARKLAFRIRDPSAQINRVAARGGFLRADVDKLRDRDHGAADRAPAQGHHDPHQESRGPPRVERRVSLRAPPQSRQLRQP